MAEYWRSKTASPVSITLADEDIAHGVGADMGEIDEHTEAVHLLNEISAGRAQTFPVWNCNARIGIVLGFQSGICIFVVTIPGKGCVADAELMEET